MLAQKPCANSDLQLRRFPSIENPKPLIFVRAQNRAINVGAIINYRSLIGQNIGVLIDTIDSIRCYKMLSIRTKLCQLCRQVHTLSRDGPSETLKRKVTESKKKKLKNPRKNQVFVQVPDSLSFLDTATMPMLLTVVGTALFAKLLMMYDDSRSQELLERKIRNAPPGQGTVRMLDREEWEGLRELRPRTPFESKLARSNARIRTGEPLKMEDVKDWTVDVLTDAVTRAEECAKRGSN